MGNIKPNQKPSVVQPFSSPGLINIAFWINRKDDRAGEWKNNPITGQKERRPRYFCGLMRFRWNPKTQKFEIGVVTYRQDGIGQPQIKFPGGCSNFNETPRQTLRKEAVEETGRAPGKGAWVLHSKFFTYKKEDGDKVENVEHIHFFFADEVEFQEHMVRLKTKSSSDGGECSPFRWETLNQELVNSFHKSHKVALQRLYEKIMQDHGGTNREKYEALMNIYF